RSFRPRTPGMGLDALTIDLGQTERRGTVFRSDRSPDGRAVDPRRRVALTSDQGEQGAAEVHRVVQPYPTRRHHGLSVRSFAMSTVYDLSFDQLAERLAAWREPAFRARQVWTQLWKRGATYEEMSDVSP